MREDVEGVVVTYFMVQFQQFLKDEKRKSHKSSVRTLSVLAKKNYSFSQQAWHNLIIELLRLTQ
jgi:hypothetical protein